MDIITIDMETYYDKDYSLSKITTEENVRSPLFEVIGVAVKINDGEPEWASGTHDELKAWLQQFDWANAMAIAHNAMFDGAILNWKFDITPKVWIDTLCMGRALHGVEVSGSLAALAVRENVGEKGTEVLNALGKPLASFSPEQLARYGDYCINDVELTYKLFNKMVGRFPKKELRLIDVTIRMFTEPVLELDKKMLYEHLADVQEKKAALLNESGVTTDDLMSNPKFAEALMELGVTPPMKKSPLTGKEAFAFAKSDEAFLNLLEHPDWRVQGLVAARLGLKSTLEETRTERFIKISERGPLPVPIKYYAAHTGRFGGSDKINLQNLPSRGVNGGKLKKAIRAPEGYSIIDADSAQIEARVLVWLAGQEEVVEAFANKEDVYKKMAMSIYGKPEDQITKPERFVGKTTILGCGYGMGAAKFQLALKASSPSVDISMDEARRIIDVYRKTNYAVTALWRQAQNALVALHQREEAQIGRFGIVKVLHEEGGIQFPSELVMHYDDLQMAEGDKGLEFSYRVRKGRTRIYGGKVVENVCQAIARCLSGEQMLRIAKRYKVVLTVHDAIACVVPDEEVATAQAYVEECMRWVPEWATGLPLNCESGVGKTYGDC